MADIEKPVRDIATEEAPKVLRVAKSVWEKAMNNPELRGLMDKFGVEGGSGGKVTVTSKDPDALDKVRSALGAPNFETVGTPYTPGEDFSTRVPEGVSTKTGLPLSGDGYVESLGITDPSSRKGLAEQLKLAEKLKGAPLDATELKQEARRYTASASPGAGSAATPGNPSREPLSINYDQSIENSLVDPNEAGGRGSLGRVLTGAAGAAGVAGAGYAASQAGGGSMPAKPTPSPASPPDGSAALQRGVAGRYGGSTSLSDSLKVPGEPAPLQQPLSAVPLLPTNTHLSRVLAPTEAVKQLRELQAHPPMMETEVAGPPSADGRTPSQTRQIRPEDTVISQKQEEAWQLQLKQIQDIAKHALRTNAWAEVAENFGHALVQLFAAKRGMETHTNLSGVKFDKTDWIKKNQQAIDEMNADLGVVSKNREAQEKRVRTLYDSLQSYRKDTADVARDADRDVAETNRTNAQIEDTEANVNRAAAVANATNLTHNLDTLVGAGSREKAAETKADASVTNAETRAGAAGEKLGTTQAAAGNTFAAEVAALGDMPSKKRDAEIPKVLSRLGKAGIGADEFQKWKDEAFAEHNWSDANAWKALGARVTSEVARRGGGGASTAPAARTVVNKEINRQTKQTRYTYSDGTTETVNGIE